MVKKALLYLFLTTYPLTLVIAQTWEPVSGGLQGYGTDNIPVYTMCVYHDKLFVGGAFEHAGDIKANNIASWNGHKWDTLNNGVYGCIEALAVHNDILCVGGEFFRAGRKRLMCLAQWVDTSKTFPPDWFVLGTRFIMPRGNSNSGPVDNCPIKAFIEYKDELYMGGTFWNMRDIKTSNHNTVLKGDTWTRLPFNNYSASKGDTSGSSSLGSYVYLDQIGYAIYMDTLYSTVASIHNNGEINDVAAWDGSKWHYPYIPPNKGDGYSFYVNTMAVYDSALYMAGDFKSAGGVSAHSIVRWDKKKWTPLGSGINGDVKTMIVYKGKLYVGGMFDTAGGKPVNNVAVWDGHEWSAVGAGFKIRKPNYAQVRAFCIYKDELYAAGNFTSSGNVPVMNIAKLQLKK